MRWLLVAVVLGVPLAMTLALGRKEKKCWKGCHGCGVCHGRSRSEKPGGR